MGLREAARFCLARALCHQRSPLSLPSEPLATQHTREENSGAERGGWGERQKKLPHLSAGFQSQAQKMMSQTACLLLIRESALLLVPHLGSRPQRQGPGPPNGMNPLL